MEGNLHVPFLGGLAGAIPPGYPVGDGDVISQPDQLEGDEFKGCTVAEQFYALAS